MSNVIHAADLFCGAGGTSTGLMNAARRLGKDVRLLAINHWHVAVETHQANHPGARHLTTGLESVTPADLVPGGKLDLLWASPSCTHHSVARGGKPRSDQSRAQPYLLLDWLSQLYVKRLFVENVPEFVNWGPLGANGLPLKSKRGALFNNFLDSLTALQYRFEWKVLCCADYGDATTRKRFFLQAVRGPAKIGWPEPTHAKDPGGLFPVKPWVAARDIIDWSIPGKSIFRRNIPLADNTLKRIEAGIRKFWGPWAEPFLVVLRGTKKGTLERTAFTLDQPLPTITAGGGHVGLVEPFLSTVAHGNPEGNYARRRHSIDDPCRTITGTGEQALIQPFIVRANNGRASENPNCRIKPLDDPLGTQTGSNTFGVCEPFILPQQACGANRDLYQPISTITATGAHALVEPFLVSFYGTGHAFSIHEPFATITARDRFGLVQTYGLDILFRMLQPHELALAHSFPRDYRFAGNKGDIVKQIGNSVPVGMSEALCYAGLSA